MQQYRGMTSIARGRFHAVGTRTCLIVDSQCRFDLFERRGIYEDKGMDGVEYCLRLFLQSGIMGFLSTVCFEV